LNVTEAGENDPTVDVGVIVTAWPAYCGGRLTVIVTVVAEPMYSGVEATASDTVSSPRTSTVAAAGAV